MTLEAFNQLCALIKAQGVVPIALGNKGKWTLPELVFEDILPGIAGAKYYQDFWRGKGKSSDPQVADTLKEALLLSGYFNDKTDELDWQDALDLMYLGIAAMGAMGDWAKGYFESKNWTADVDFGVIQFPGEYPVFVYTSDSFPLPINDAPSHDLAAQLLQTFASVESQVEFNKFKGSIPARQDIDLGQYPDSFDAMHLRTYQAFQSADRALAMSGLLPSGLMNDLDTTLRDSLAQGTDTLIQLYLDKNYSTLVP